jgi:hypothetical protein
MSIPDYIVKQYGTSDIEEIKKAKDLENTISKGITDDVLYKSLDIKEVKQMMADVGLDYFEGAEERTATFTISTEDLDRSSEIVIQDGIDKSDYLKNPVIHYVHNTSTVPIGKTLKIWRAGKTTKALAVFFTKEIEDTGLAETIFKLVKAGAMKGASLSGKVLEAHYPDEKEAKLYKMSPYGRFIDKCLMTEWSVCSIPCNANTLKKSLTVEDFDMAKSFGLIEEENKTDIIEENNKLKETITGLTKSVEELKIKMSEINNTLTNFISKGLKLEESKNDDSDYLLSKIDSLIKKFN